MIACGPCSSAEDFWAYIESYGRLETETVVCAIAYTLGDADTRFDTLKECMREKFGYSEGCAYVWAHRASVSTSECAEFCFPEANGLALLQLEPPTCADAPCLACASEFDGPFQDVVGRTYAKSGILERIAAKCSEIPRLTHDPCVGTTERGDLDETTTEDPEPSTSETDDNSRSCRWAMMSWGFIATTALVTALL